MAKNTYKLCPYHKDGLGWDACTEGWDGKCEVAKAREARKLERKEARFITHDEAHKLDDRFDDPFYAEYDEDFAMYCVFGVQSGHAYTNRASLEEATARAEEMNARLRERKGR